MNTFQTLCALVLLVFLLSVIVQAFNEFAKRLLSCKANEIETTFNKFWGNILPLDQVKQALATRGLNIKALENLNKDDFRKILDDIQLGLASTSVDVIKETKDKIAASYEAARISFQQAYTTYNKKIAAILSFIVVIVLNANIIILYEQISVDQVAQQAILSKAASLGSEQIIKSGQSQSQQTDLGKAYKESREQIDKVLQNYPILIRTSKLPEDFATHPIRMILGLIIMGFLVTLGAPFWNDVLKTMMGINGSLNTNGKKAS